MRQALQNSFDFPAPVTVGQYSGNSFTHCEAVMFFGSFTTGPMLTLRWCITVNTPLPHEIKYLLTQWQLVFLWRRESSFNKFNNSFAASVTIKLPGVQELAHLLTHMILLQAYRSNLRLTTNRVATAVQLQSPLILILSKLQRQR